MKVWHEGQAYDETCGQPPGRLQSIVSVHCVRARPCGGIFLGRERISTQTAICARRFQLGSVDLVLLTHCASGVFHRRHECLIMSAVSAVSVLGPGVDQGVLTPIGSRCVPAQDAAPPGCDCRAGHRKDDVPALSAVGGLPKAVCPRVPRKQRVLQGLPDPSGMIQHD